MAKFGCGMAAAAPALARSFELSTRALATKTTKAVTKTTKGAAKSKAKPKAKPAKKPAPKVKAVAGPSAADKAAAQKLAQTVVMATEALKTLNGILKNATLAVMKVNKKAPK